MNKIFKHESKKLWILFTITFIIALIFYNYLPKMIPIHFDVAGNIDKSIIFFLIVALLVLIPIIYSYIIYKNKFK